MSRKLFCALIAIFIVASVLISANKLEKEPVFISPSSGEVTIGLKQYAVTRTGWGTCSKGLTQDFVDHAVFSLELYKEGVLIQTVTMDEGYWVWTTADPDPRCLHINEPMIASWRFEDLDLKSPGTYTLWFYRDWTVPLGDGYDVDGDGYMDVYPPGTLLPREVTIYVLP